MCSIATWHSRKFASYWLVAQLTGSSDRTSSCAVLHCRDYRERLTRMLHTFKALSCVMSANVCSLSRNIATLHNPLYTLRLHAGTCSHDGTLSICRITGELSPLAAHDLSLCSATLGLASNAHHLQAPRGIHLEFTHVQVGSSAHTRQIRRLKGGAEMFISLRECLLLRRLH